MPISAAKRLLRDVHSQKDSWPAVPFNRSVEDGHVVRCRTRRYRALATGELAEEIALAD
jgi:hypothetical protein